MNNMLPVYKSLVSNYEEVKQLYAVNEETIIKCSKIVAYNTLCLIVKWRLYLLNGLMIYQSGRYLSNQGWSIELIDVNIAPGTQFKLKAIVTAGRDNTSNVILEYDPESNATAYFELKGEGSLRKLILTAVVGDNI